MAKASTFGNIRQHERSVGAADHFGKDAAVVGALIQLGACFDLPDEKITSLLAASFPEFADSFAAIGEPLPVNKGKEKKLRELDCAVIDDCLDRLARRNVPFDTVRGAFFEGRRFSPERLFRPKRTFR